MNIANIEEYIFRTYSAQHALVNAGLLVGPWANVACHCFVQAVTVETLADLLGLPEHDKALLSSVAACHDWDKRLKKCPQDFNRQASARIMTCLNLANPDPILLNATKPAFLLRAKKGEAKFLEFLQFFVDDMTMGDKIVPFDDRLAEVRQRNPHPDDEVERQLNRPYWDEEEALGGAVAQMIFGILEMRKIRCRSLAQLINQKLDERFP